jgi:MFS family permease
MRNWMLRGLALAALMVVVRLFQGALINTWQQWAAWISAVLLLLFIVCAAVWGAIDGRADASANRDPDRRQDLAMTWLLAGLVAGVVSGAISWLIALVYKGIYTGGLLNEVTTFAAFTALVVFLSGVVGVTLGRWRVDRQFEKTPEKHHGLGVKERDGDTDVFSAVRADESPTGEIPAARTEERTASVATAEREASTETIPTGTWGGSPKATRPTDDDAKTEVIPTETDPKHSRSEPEKD